MKTIIITGGTDGIGKQTALNIALQKHHVIIVGRNEDKCESVCSEISTITIVFELLQFTKSPNKVYRME